MSVGSVFVREADVLQTEASTAAAALNAGAGTGTGSGGTACSRAAVNHMLCFAGNH